MTEDMKPFYSDSSDYDNDNFRKYLEDNIDYVGPSIIVYTNKIQDFENEDQDTFSINITRLFSYNEDSSNSNDEILCDENLCNENT